MLIAGTLSRVSLPDGRKQQTTFYTVNTVQRVDLQPVENTNLQRATAKDKVLQSLLDTVQSGWPQRQCELPDHLLPYGNVRDEIAHDKGLLFRGQQKSSYLLPVAPRFVRVFMSLHIRELIHIFVEPGILFSG